MMNLHVSTLLIIFFFFYLLNYNFKHAIYLLDLRKLMCLACITTGINSCAECRKHSAKP
jgi:hypothetical protein